MVSTLAVPDTFPTLHAALEVASDGAVVTLAPGSYRERIDLAGRHAPPHRRPTEEAPGPADRDDIQLPRMLGEQVIAVPTSSHS